MARKWKTTVLIWIGVLLYFGIGSAHPRDADLFLISFHWVLLLAATVYTAMIWVHDQAKGEPEQDYHLSAYPQRFLEFALDQKKPESGRRVRPQSELQ